jgi:hypothetical protein
VTCELTIAREAKSLGIDVVLEPFINIDRDITFGRGYNAFGEGPVLTGEIGAAEIRGIQSQGIMAQAKHYVAYDSGGEDVIVDQQALHEVYVAPFRDAVAAGVSSIMCSYNKWRMLRFASPEPIDRQEPLVGPAELPPACHRRCRLGRARECCPQGSEMMVMGNLSRTGLITTLQGCSVFNVS